MWRKGSLNPKPQKRSGTLHCPALQDGEDEVPKQWLPPYAGPGATVASSAKRAPSAGRAACIGGSARAGPRVGPGAGGRALAQDVRISSKPDLRGLGQALARGGERGTLGCALFRQDLNVFSVEKT